MLGKRPPPSPAGPSIGSICAHLSCGAQTVKLRAQEIKSSLHKERRGRRLFRHHLTEERAGSAGHRAPLSLKISKSWRCPEEDSAERKQDEAFPGGSVTDSGGNFQGSWSRRALRADLRKPA
ncbi:hypothetical protein OJAV_G00216870 [Oryzias javanicus]|uniref:Uncharacterized protein n=1 Tax=Oryzias javanicus TaxID=123683 RepID=A0A3S2NVK1_ORYJA|nr:hypothetical protein OJAV_G00216870 [Oryzias javanicus]